MRGSYHGSGGDADGFLDGAIRYGTARRTLRLGWVLVWRGGDGNAPSIALRLACTNSPVSEVTFLWQGGACAFPPVLGTPGSLPADRCFDTLLVSVQRLGLVPRVAYTFDQDLLKTETLAMFIVAPVDAPPPKTLARLRDFVRAGGSLIVLDDTKIGQRGSAKDFLRLFDATVTYHGAESHDHAERPHVHVGGGMLPIKAPAADAFVAQQRCGRGDVVYMTDAADFSREGMGHCFTRPWKAARARYDTIFMLLRDVLRIAPENRRFLRDPLTPIAAPPIASPSGCRGWSWLPAGAGRRR